MIKINFRLQIGNGHYKNPYLHTKMHYLPKKTLKVNSLFESIYQHIYIILAVYILHLIKLDRCRNAATSLVTTSTAWPYKRIRIENPGFHRIHAIIKSCDRQIHPIPLDEKGLIFLAYTIQMPMSHTLHHHTNFHLGLLCLYLEG